MTRGYLKVACSISIVFCLLGFVSAQTTKPKSKPTPKPVEQYKAAREGVGIEGIAVGKSTVTDVEKKFGKAYKWTAHKKYSYSMAYPKLGLTFYICQADKRREIFDIEIKQPYRAKTGKGIILGKSTLDDIYKAYGKSKDGLEYRGVNFYYANYAGKKTVTVIDIVENSGIRQCKENK